MFTSMCVMGVVCVCVVCMGFVVLYHGVGISERLHSFIHSFIHRDIRHKMTDACI